MMAARVNSLRRRSGRHALVFLAALFLASAALRAGTLAAQALAAGGTADPPAESATCTTEAGVMELLQAVRDREATVARREAELETRARTAAMATEALGRERAALISAEEKLAATLALADQASERDVTTLVAVYENMKPKDAVPLFEEMAPDFAGGFLARMRPEIAAAILAGMDPKKAHLISVVLAGRNARAPRE